MAGFHHRVPIALLGALLLAGALRTEASEIMVPPGSGMTILIKQGTPAAAGRPCYIIVARRQVTMLLVKPGEKVSIVFSCPDPERYFVLEIQKNIDCMSGLCPLGEVRLQPPTSELPRLNRTFIWDVKAHKSVGLELQFPLPRLRQIAPGEKCPDGAAYSISGRIDATVVQIGTFCRNGTVSRIKTQEGVKVALHLPWFLSRNTSGFNITNRSSSIKRLCIIESVFEGEGSATLMSANYPEAFPEDELMTWQFVIPAHLRASVSFLNFSVSNCERKEERVEYYIPGSTTNPEVFKLGDKQPGNMAGNFNLSLQGCDQDAQSPGILRLQFQVLVQHPQNESNKTYVIDLSQERSMSLTIEPRHLKHGRKFVPGCFVCLESRTCSTNVTLTAGSKHTISFLCDDLTRLWVNAEKTISCLEPRYCYKRSYPLRVPGHILQLPVELRDFSWKLLVPKDQLSLVLVPAQKLQQHTQERVCNTSYSYLVGSSTGGHDFGYFCPGGSIERILVKENSSVTLRTFASSFLQDVSRQSLTVSFIPNLKEEGIFTVTPDTTSKVYLRTPNWDRGMPALSSVSWNISVPREQEAYLTFYRERSGVVCQSGRAYMIIQEQQSQAEEIFSLEDDILPKPRCYHHSFWVNISNCSPASSKQLNLLFWVTLTPRSLDLPVIVIAVVGGGVVLLTVLLLIICLLKKKKKQLNKGPVVGIYNGHINTQMPRQPRKFPKGRADNDSHVYAVIDDCMVYGHLLQEGSNGSFLRPEVDTYRPFQGPMGDCPPSPPPIGSRAPTTKLSSDEVPPCTPPESESEPYTFSHPHPHEGSQRDTDIPLLETQQPEKPAAE
ncbi:CUB domain-containing protein 1 [Dipodomys spectabilis]|uniref:CUB domain-containing protein 1 n=1 Tax=Dipodomys spectabilis TaxID=105255 RepID=UPI001C5362B3|nr:CUB domain-containing protein 1 [Dipodomys spectabilis]